MLESLFSPPIVLVVLSDLIADPAALLVEEQDRAARMSPQRKQEFTAGRTAAREALRRLGLGAVPLLPGPRRAPQWPPGVTGSITHCEGLTAAAVAPTSSVLALGLDAEPCLPIPDDLETEVATAAEKEWVDDQGSARGEWLRLLFSAKEAVYKATFPLTGVELGFLDLTVEWEPSLHSFRVTLPQVVKASLPAPITWHGGYRRSHRHLLTGFTILSGAT